ncbi:hypothetical protein HanRHA438_Chr09g0380901 [Helianthus annuus]|uniref:Uncharacterized protein n=1 Tax=Helianthus annuus TaxID=4232 RepID=A0A251TT90_HELAN|nr:hypothetical protein HanXRQr2_Chr09g0369331 [Helianthus annuus]KAJ0524716.1 hypothetical protein HanHA300_Chr09g0303771 [Helianthus annuus]KAJ0541023.1 hypothetical protein HanHA89_Chr09g0323761 [Helianthus annuus]KAJ0706106.1 hypothetical protein HanLR1_Chr09g0303261 [Helianthus annuus]KAJ0886563.1 hypothetical protein HanRHA438_Chr09g0380901 [Helianthus annuus]
MDRQPSHHHSDDGRTSGELPALDCHITSLCDHIQSETSNHGLFSNVIMKAMVARWLSSNFRPIISTPLAKVIE